MGSDAAPASNDSRPVVVHSLRKFLPMSQNWIYPQITALRRYQAMVFANQTVNGDAFPLGSDRLKVIPRRHRPWAEGISGALRLGRDTPSYWRRALDGVRPSVIHSHFGNRGYYDLPVARRLGLPQVVTFYGHDLSRLPNDPVWQRRFAALFRRASLLTVEGSHMRACLARLGCPEDKIRIRRHGVDLQRFAFVPRALGTDGRVKVLVAARFVEKKGVTYAIQAAALVARRHPELQLTVIGDAGENDLEGQAIKREVLSLLASDALRSRSQWVGSVPIAEFTRIAVEHHIFVQPSVHARDGDMEGGAPVSLIQLAATGIPIVATTHCDIPEIVIDGVTGALAPERDVEALAAGLERLVAAPASWERIGQQARQHIEKVFEMSRTIDDLESIYDDARRSPR